MPYRYVTTETESTVDHAEHIWEEWVGYLSSTLPDWANGNDTGLCCHTCQLIIIDRPRA